MTHNAGEFRWKLDILELTKSKRNSYAWAAKGTAWAKADFTARDAIFSRHGVTARSVKLAMLTQPSLTLHDALFLHGTGHLFITDINREDPFIDTVTAAIIEPRRCRVERTRTAMGGDARPEIKKRQPLHFPGYVTEKYLRQSQGEPMSWSEERYVLITPKDVKIQTGELVKVGKELFEAVIPHMLDPHRNEYEILRRHDN